MSVIQEEHEEISPAITLLRKPRFSRQFSKRREDPRYISPSAATGTGDKFREIRRSQSPEPESSESETDNQTMAVTSRRSSDSSVVSSPFKVLPPIPNVSEDSDKEEEDNVNKNEDHHDENEIAMAMANIIPKKALKVSR